ncbi:MAG: hypothetical protein F6K10_37685 [Moorea sp. SIO2B7]|nr:hypothetical protein [Moorena sp. SIO2B7]
MTSSLKTQNNQDSKEILLKNIHVQGYHLLPELLSLDIVKEARNFLKEKFEEKFVDEELERDDTISDCLCVYPELMDTFFNDRLLESIRMALGDKFVLLSASCIRNS